MKFAPVLLLALSASFAIAQYPGAAPVPASFKKGFNSIKVDDAKTVLTFLATQCEGRGTGQPGFFKAAEYVAAQFKAAGLKPVGDKGTYFQNVPFYKYTVDPAQSYLATEDGGVKIIGDQSISFGRLGANADVTAGVVILKASGDSTLEDAKQLDGKIVLVVGPTSTGLRRQVRQATTAAVVYVSDTVARGLGSVSRRQGSGSSSVTSISISTAAARRPCAPRPPSTSTA